MLWTPKHNNGVLYLGADYSKRMTKPEKKHLATQSPVNIDKDTKRQFQGIIRPRRVLPRKALLIINLSRHAMSLFNS